MKLHSIFIAIIIAVLPLRLSAMQEYDYRREFDGIADVERSTTTFFAAGVFAAGMYALTKSLYQQPAAHRHAAFPIGIMTTTAVALWGLSGITAASFHGYYVLNPKKATDISCRFQSLLIATLGASTPIFAYKIISMLRALQA